MLERVLIRGFKSLEDVELSLAPLVVLCGPNAAGKSNFLEALLVLSRCATARTLSDALDPPLRGYPVEAFALPATGLPGLLARAEARFLVGGDLAVNRPAAKTRRFRYHAEIGIVPAEGTLALHGESLVALSGTGNPRGKPRIERVDDHFIVRRSEKGQPEKEPLLLTHTLLSVPRFTGDRYPDFDLVRGELANWRSYYLDPLVEMRQPQPPREVTDLGTRGQWLAPFLYRLKHHPSHAKQFQAVARALRHAIPSIDHLDVELDSQRGTLDLSVRQEGTVYSSRVISEGTLRVLALCAIAANPGPSSLVLFEEPENGVHPRRIEVLADLLKRMSERHQVVVTTHSPLFMAAMLRRQRDEPERVQLLRCFREGRASRIAPLMIDHELFQEGEIRNALRGPEDADDVVQAMLVRGWLDG